MANINFTCPHCSFSKQLPASAEGQQGNCPSCKAVVTITATAPPSPSASPQQPLTPQTSQSRDRSGNRNKLVLAASAVVIVVLCISGSLLVYLSPQGGMSIPLISDKTDFDATGEKIFNALRERSTAKLQSHIINDVVLNNVRAKIREGVPESLQAAFDDKNTRANVLNFSDRYMAKVSSFFIGFLSNEEARHPELKSQWENIEYIGITGSLPRERDGGRERLIDPFKLTYDYSGSYDPDFVRNATIWFRLDDKIYQMRGIEAMLEIDGKWYGMGDDGVTISKVTKEQFPRMLTDDLANLRLSMYGGTEKVLVQVREELGLSSAN